MRRQIREEQEDSWTPKAGIGTAGAAGSAFPEMVVLPDIIVGCVHGNGFHCVLHDL